MWFGHQKTFTPTNQDHEGFKRQHHTEIGFYARNLIISEHAGTHTDATIEYDPAGLPIDQLALEMYYGSAVCLDLSEAQFVDPDPDYRGWATEDVVRRAEAKLEAAGRRFAAGTSFWPGSTTVTGTFRRRSTSTTTRVSPGTGWSIWPRRVW
ncbi:cyclase family protein [Mycobacterium sp. MS1601]|uniref:cyclase family protein n=1 Tax=Mycobacterium sp. MS1601 TaxID=1936029 RepID=UPI003FA52DC4